MQGEPEEAKDEVRYLAGGSECLLEIVELDG